MSYRNQSISRAFQILEVLCDHPTGLAVSEVGALCDLHRATAHRLLEVLRAQGYVTKSPKSGRYSIGFRMGRFGNKPLIVQRVLTHSRPRLTALAHALNAVVSLGSLRGFHAVTAERFIAPTAIMPRNGIPKVVDAHVSAIGKVLLALQSEQYVWRGLRDVRLTSHTGNSIIDPKRLMNHLADIRQNNLALDDEEFIAGYRSAGAALINPAGRATCAVSVMLPSHRLTRIELASVAEAIRGTCREIVRDVVDRAAALDAAAE